VCNGDRDYFRFFALQGQWISLDATFYHGLGDIEMDLFADNETQALATSRSSDDNESIFYQAPYSGYFDVGLWTYDDGNSYELSIFLL
jgi:hypothetical protein